jgi:hypothetical protein
MPRVILTDGLQAYAYLLPAAKPGLCRFHQQWGATHWLTRHFATDTEIAMRTPAMKRVLQIRDRRTVHRGLAQLKARATALGITPWATGVEEKLPQLMGRVGSRRVPSISHTIDRFFWAFERFYKTHQGFPSALSAKRALCLFFVV